MSVRRKSAKAPVQVRRRMPRRRRWLDRFGWYEARPSGQWTTTRQAEALNTAVTRSAPQLPGIPIGLNQISKEVVVVDQFAQYGIAGDAGITAGLVVIIADMGTGKSSLCKTQFATRQMIPYRQAVILDKKRQSGRGEYTQIAQDLGAASVVFEVGGSRACINPMDPAISASGEHTNAEPGAVPPGQEALIAAIIQDPLPRPMTPREYALLGAALDAVNGEAAADGREPVIGDLAHRLLNPRPEDAKGLGPDWPDRFEEWRTWGHEIGITLQRLAERDLKGLVDRPTSPEVREALETHPFVHFDLSALPTSGPAVRIVMSVINTWLANRVVLRSKQFKQTVLVVEEAWHVAQGSTGEVFLSSAKQSRGTGMSIVAAFHHPADVDPTSPAYALMREASIVFVGRQSRADDAKAVCDIYHFPPGTEDTLMRLPKGRFLVKMGSMDPFLLEHVRSPQEVLWTDTDAAMRGHQ